MQEEKILSNAIGKLLKEMREKTGKSLNLFCNEFDIPASTLNDLENAKRSVKVFSLYKIIKAYNLSTSEFFEKLDKELPENFLSPEE